MAGAMIDITRGWKHLEPDADQLVSNITAQMDVFPLCCSTGVLKNVTAHALGPGDSVYFDKLDSTKTPTKEQIKACTYLHELVRLVQRNRRMVFPIQVARWNAMSLMLQKVETGKDDSDVGGYNNFKAAQITFFDRLNEDKRNKKFKFSVYNTTYSCDQLMEWLGKTRDKYGTVYVSPAVPGAHGARVRGCVFTPNHKAFKAYHDERFPLVKAHVLALKKIIDAAPKSKYTF